jgi:SAM-dependent methyltransferase
VICVCPSGASGGSLDIRSIFAVPSVYDAFQDFVGANALKQRFLATYIPSGKPLRVLEVGCGPGRNLDYLPETVDYTGCDLSAKYIAHAKKRYGHRAQFYCLSVADLGNLELDKFDIVMSIGTLHHLSDDLVQKLSRETLAVLKNEGFFLALEPCWTDHQSWIDRTIMSYDRGEDIRTIGGYTKLLRQTFRDAEGHELDTDVIIYPTSACVIRAGYLAP